MSGPRKLRRESTKTVELGPWEAGRPKPEDVLSGPVEMEIAVLWWSRDRRSANGLFKAQPSRLHVVHPLDQTLVVPSGAVAYKEEGEQPLVLETGDALVI